MRNASIRTAAIIFLIILITSVLILSNIKIKDGVVLSDIYNGSKQEKIDNMMFNMALPLNKYYKVGDTNGYIRESRKD